MMKPAFHTLVTVGAVLAAFPGVTGWAARVERATRAAFKDDSANYLQLIRRHYDRMIEVGVDRYGPIQSALWLASVDTEKGANPTGPTRQPNELTG